MIVTVTPNPSIDRTLRVPFLRRGEVIRVGLASAEAGGKGINVSRALATMGASTLAVAPATPADASLLLDLLAGSTPLRTVPATGSIRVNLSLVESDGTVTKLNEPGPMVGAPEGDALLDALVAAITEALTDAGRGEPAWVVGCGSLPPGLREDFYAELAARLPDDVHVAVDADRAALRAVVGQPIALLKPNRSELEDLVGSPLTSLGQVADAAADLVAGGSGQVLVSLGPDGALVVDAFGACHGEARIDDVANPVGAGDALLAGYLAGGADRAALRMAIAWSVAACRAPGTRMPPVTARDEAAVVIRTSLDRAREVAG